MSRRALLLFGAMCLIWGIPYLLIRVAVREMAPSVLVLGRTAIGAGLLLPLAARRGDLRGLWAHRWPLLAFAAVEIAAPWLLLGTAEKRLTSSLTGLLLAAVPLIGAVVATFSGDDDRLGGQRLAGLLIGLGGVAAIVGLDLGSTDVAALTEVGATAVGYAVGPIILSRYLSDLPGLGVISVSLAVCAIGYAPVAAFELPSSVPSGRALASVVGLAAICTALAFVLFFKLIAEVGPTRATVITYINPAVAAVLGVSILGERFTVGMAVGFAFVLLGSVLATRPGARREGPPAIVATET
ncbi:MAG TPA: DMT family transporter [Gaiellaceae bacterium]